MKLIYRILLRLSLALLAVLTVWTVFFYFTMIDEINDEVDDALEDYSETIIIRSLAGKELPSKNDGSNNSYSIRPITREEARQYPAIEYYDADIYIKEKEETEPARVLRTIFADKDDNYFLLEVSTPSFEKEDLRGTDYEGLMDKITEDELFKLEQEGKIQDEWDKFMNNKVCPECGSKNVVYF